MSKQYAVYVRVSTDKDEQISSVENQIDICRNWLERQGFEWDRNCVYKDHGISGTLFLERPAIQLIIEKAKRREIGMIIFKSISRLARDLKDSLEIREVLTAHHVRIISIEEGYDSNKAGKNDMAFELWSLFSAQYSRTLSAGVSAAITAKVRRGEHIGKIPYGYDRVNGVLQINEEEAKVVRMIYDWYNQGWGYKRIANGLNRLNIKSKTNMYWQNSTVQRLIQNPVFCGDFILNQYCKVKVGGRKKQIKNPKEKWLFFKDHHQPIVTRETWEKANRTKEKKEKVKVTPFNDLRGICRCSECSNTMVISGSVRTLDDGSKQKYNYLKCGAYRRAGVCIPHAPIPFEELRSFIIDLLKKKGQSISFNFVNEMEAKKQEQIKVLQKQINQLEAKQKDLLDLLLDKIIGKSEFEEKRKELDGKIRQLENEVLHLSNTGYSQEFVRNIQQAFESLEMTNEDMHGVFKTLIKEIIIYPNRKLDITYHFEDPISMP